jgi:drug/metabolite transporter (DMT)-like permease
VSADTPYYLALGANLCFASGSIVFARFSRRAGPVWMNAFKACVALSAFAITVPLAVDWSGAGWGGIGALLFSGAIGLGIGDIFLLSAFARVGAGRTLMVFSFQPLVLALLAFLLFGQTVEGRHLVAIGFFMLCIGTLALEDRQAGAKRVPLALGFALIGMLLDATGILITRSVFDSYPAMSPLEGNLHRLTGAILFFGIYSMFRPIRLAAILRELPLRERAFATIAALVGTYLSLMLYLAAIKHGHLASLAGITITSTTWASGIECVIDRTWPSRYLIGAFGFFLFGILVLLG